MDPRIREGDQCSRQVIRAFLLLLSGLRVFAVKILGFGGFDRKGSNHLAEKGGIRWVRYKKNPWVLSTGFNQRSGLTSAAIYLL